ncbi:baseplate wedge subunit [Xanthomonas phage vB_XveM_DIBBI]|uniref:Uncharacterized protein n=2 Tax=Dibbivirus TaxID=2843374 RepID=I3PGV7_9CAUD|nr:baseplate wedge subunit [Xanthomonas phage vB_XveM_DIBBI]YP_009845958.1 baseplate wedge subunit [Pantoea phage vB_PagM_PSKM]AEX65692.1 hypothetical protein DIBBI_024 [Xanthomonas phage vB_XveM_DIBBI]QDH45781.1 putative baseplate component [Pantoea phage vB_PagM_PSKM]
MIDIKCEDGKWIFENGDIVLIDGAERVRQQLEFRLSLWRGEWFLDPDFGTPYNQQILGKALSLSGALAAIKEQILDVDGVDRITEFNYTFERKTRKLSVNFECSTSYGIIRYGV